MIVRRSKAMRVFVAGKLVQRTWQDDAGNKRQTVEIQVSHVGPNLQFATAEVTKSTAEGLKASSDGRLRPRPRTGRARSY